MTAATPTVVALTAFIAWTLALLLLMEAIRSLLVVTGRVPANGFTPDNAALSPFMQRLARAHANCLEGLPIFGGLMLVALVTGRAAVTDPLAYALIGVIGSEFIMATGGMGYEIAFAYNNFDNAVMYPLILLVLLVSIGINAALGAWERRVLARRGRQA